MLKINSGDNVFIAILHNKTIIICVLCTVFAAAGTCIFPGCMRSKYKEPTGLVHDFCGRTHADLYKKTYLSSSSSYTSK